MKFHLVTTDHLSDNVLFRDDADFRAAMNFIAITSFVLNVPVLSFILMSNHVHFVLACSNDQSIAFINHFKMLYSFYYRKKYGIGEFLRKHPVDIRELSIKDESLQRGIAYVQMNCVAANITPHPSLYPWGTGASFFNLTKPYTTYLSSYSERQKRALFHSHVRLPDEYVIGNEGFILPQSYVAVTFVEKLYQNPKRYTWFLNSSSKSKLHLEKNAAPSFRDQVLISAVQDLSMSLFRAQSIKSLSADNLAELIRQIQRRFSADANQISRVINLPYDKVALMLEGFN